MYFRPKTWKVKKIANDFIYLPNHFAGQEPHFLCQSKTKCLYYLGYVTSYEYDVLSYFKVIQPKYYKHLKKVAHQSHLGRLKMGWFLAD